jgi:hypothetical protein
LPLRPGRRRLRIMSHAAAPSGLDERPSAPIAPRRPLPSERKNAHRGLATCRRPASGKPCSQAPIASGKNRRLATTARRSHLLQQSNPTQNNPPQTNPQPPPLPPSPPTPQQTNNPPPPPNANTVITAGHVIEAGTTIVIGVALAPAEVPIGVAVVAITGSYLTGELIGEAINKAMGQ